MVGGLRMTHSVRRPSYMTFPALRPFIFILFRYGHHTSDIYFIIWLIPVLRIPHSFRHSVRHFIMACPATFSAIMPDGLPCNIMEFTELQTTGRE